MKAINKIYLHFTYIIIECVKLNRLNILEKYLNKFNHKFRKRYKLEIKKVEDLTTLILTNQFRVSDIETIDHRLIYVVDNQKTHNEVVCLDNNLIKKVTGKYKSSVSEIDTGFSKKRYKVTV